MQVVLSPLESLASQFFRRYGHSICDGLLIRDDDLKPDDQPKSDSHLTLDRFREIISMIPGVFFPSLSVQLDF